MFEQDKGRMQDLYKKIDVLPLDSAALAGTSFTINREYIASQLGFKQIAENSLDVASDRNFINPKGRIPRACPWVSTLKLLFSLR